LVDAFERPAWHRLASCRGTPTAWWSPPESARPDDPVVMRAAAICADCPVPFAGVSGSNFENNTSDLRCEVNLLMHVRSAKAARRVAAT
jgi:hypothetical protein